MSLVVAQWSVDVFYEDVEALPDPETPEFDTVVRGLEEIVGGRMRFGIVQLMAYLDDMYPGRFRVVVADR